MNSTATLANRLTGTGSMAANARQTASQFSKGFDPTHGRPITLWTLLDAFRRKWLPALGLGIPAALVTGAILWFMVPAKYESTALLQIQQYENRLLDGTSEQQSEFLTYRDSQINFLKSRHVLTAALRREGVATTETLSRIQYPVEWLDSSLDCEPDISPEFIRISLQGERPSDLQVIVNAVKDAYMEEVVYNEKKERVQALRVLEEKFKSVDTRVKANQDRVDRLADELGTGRPEIAIINQKLMQDHIRDLQQELTQLNNRIRAEEAARQYAREHGMTPSSASALLSGRQGFGETPASGTSATGARTNSLQQQLLQVRESIRVFEAQIRNQEHPDLVALREREQAILTALGGPETTSDGQVPEVVNSYEWLVAQRERVRTEIDDQLAELQQNSRRLVELEREREENSVLEKERDRQYQEILRRELELDVPDRIKVIQHANLPQQRSVKARTQLAALGTMGVFGAIVAGFTLFEWFSHRVGRASDITEGVGLPVIGTLPSPDRGGLLGLGVFAGKVNPTEWNRAVMESMDVVRTWLLRQFGKNESTALVISSASANEGKTTVACQLAASVARTGRQTIIVDCDFRRPSAHLLVEASPTPGVCELIRGEATLEDVVQPTPAEDLYFLGAGQFDQPTLQKLAADGGRSLIELLQENFDFVIIDTSPLLFVAEPSMLAQHADGVLMTARRDYSRVTQAVQARDLLNGLNVNLLGTVMVGADSDFQRETYGYRQDIVRSGNR